MRSPFFCRRLYSPLSKSWIVPTSIFEYRALSTKQSFFIRRALPLLSLASVPVRSLSVMQIENKEDFDRAFLYFSALNYFPASPALLRG